MTKQSAGILLFRGEAEGLEVLLAHPGGPFWARKDEGAWTIPKGEIDEGEDPRAAAWREFEEETGCMPAGEGIALGSIRQPSGKVVHAWAVRGELDPAELKSNTFTLEWPPRSGKMREFPEVDRAGWFALPEAREKIAKGQVRFLDELVKALESRRHADGAG